MKESSREVAWKCLDFGRAGLLKGAHVDLHVRIRWRHDRLHAKVDGTQAEVKPAATKEHRRLESQTRHIWYKVSEDILQAASEASTAASHTDTWLLVLLKSTHDQKYVPPHCTSNSGCATSYLYDRLHVR